jgi:hypothetical protein
MEDMNQNMNQDMYPNTNQQQPANGFAIASLVLGIVSFFCFGAITGILAIIFGAVAKKQGNTGKMATAGLVLGIIGVALYIVAIAIWGSALGVLSTYM